MRRGGEAGFDVGGMGDAVGTGAGVAVNGEVARAGAPGAAGSGMGVVSLVRPTNRTVTNPNRPPYRTDRSSGDSATSIRSWTLHISSRVGKRVYQSVVLGSRDFPYIRFCVGQ